ncbi:aminotransferase class I/II-fold pyridoxal phosphate-dependent enzyme [Streptomyces varsoviensis]|uniref:aminotransferase class I/II-fold pyridoxal phosphate-dependent enzyme n=1 Tax=Streptomyces varsoviensis TaxID=67373 RepID=UPI0004CA214D|nr:aminotransferase class I/II-fold pyridoxal phosphate-dependent enzyme [Streptomyces varsoviensis]
MTQPIAPALAAPESGLPVLPELAERVAGAAGRAEPEPVGGGPVLHAAACGYFGRRGLWTEPGQVVAAPGAQGLLLALLASVGGDVLLTRPCAAWYTAVARLAGGASYHVPVPAECGGVPDPFALLETVRRIRGEGGRPRVLVLSVADDPTGTLVPPETLHEVCEAAEAEELLIISDETWRDTRYDAHGTVVVGPAEMCPEHTVVLTDLAGSLTPTAWPAALARLPDTEYGRAVRDRTLAACTAVRALLAPPVAAAVAHALDEPEPVRARMAAAARLFGALATAAHGRLALAGALCRPPQAGPFLYADLGELRPALAARGVSDSVELEDHLGARLGVRAPGGHRFADDPDALRVRFSPLALLPGDAARQRALDAAEPLESPDVARALAAFGAVLGELTEG